MAGLSCILRTIDCLSQTQINIPFVYEPLTLGGNSASGSPPHHLSSCILSFCPFAPVHSERPSVTVISLRSTLAKYLLRTNNNGIPARFSPTGSHPSPNTIHRYTEQPTHASSINKHGLERSRDILLSGLHHYRTTSREVAILLRVQLPAPDRIGRPIGLRRHLQRLRLSECPRRRLGLSHRLRGNGLQVQHQCVCGECDKSLRKLLPEHLWVGDLFAGF